MQFLYPSFLWALFAISIPIFIHLFNFRKYKKIYFSNVAFLQALQLETKKQSKLRQLLILLARILTVICLVLAFAQPIIPFGNNTKVNYGDKAISIFIDNSFSMEAQGEDGRLQDMAILYAKEIIEAANTTDKIQILTQDFEGRHQLFYSKDEALQLLYEIKNSSQSRTLSEILVRQKDLLHQSNISIQKAYYISDFQKSSCDWEKLSSDSTVYTQFIQLKPNKISNLFIDSCWLPSPELSINKNLEMMVRIRNTSEEEFKDQQLEVSIDGETKIPSIYSIASKNQVDVPVTISFNKPGYHHGKLKIVDSEIYFDDEFFFSVNIPEKINIAHLKGNTTTNAVEKVFAGDPYFNVTTISGGQIDFSAIANYHFIILNEMNEISPGMSSELKKFVENGGSVFVIPSVSINSNSYQNFSTSLGIGKYNSIDTTNCKLARIDKEQPFFQDVFESIPNNMDVPFIKNSYSISAATTALDEDILKTNTGGQFLVRNKINNGSVYLLSVSLNESFSNLTKHVVFVPILIKAALLSVNASKLYYTISEDDYAELYSNSNDDDRVVSISSLDKKIELIPEQKLLNSKVFIYFNQAIQNAGIYNVYKKDLQIGQLAINYNKKESYTDVYTKDEIVNAISTKENFGLLDSNKEMIKNKVLAQDQGIRLWKWFIIGALIFIAIEILLLRFLKK